jgi:hypothetical protein
MFYHKRNYSMNKYLESCVAARGGSTFYLEEIPAWLFDQLKEGDFFEKKVGKAKCHPDDVYCKKTGREEALRQAKKVRLTVEDIRELASGNMSMTLYDGQHSFILVRYAGRDVAFLEAVFE